MIKKPQPLIILYSGYGTSHSWIWCCRFLKKAGFFNVHLSSYLEREKILRAQCLIISGGDTLSIAEELGEKGAHILREFIEKGGLYIGTCAGAYLFLRSSHDKLKNFSFLKSPIHNLMKNIPRPFRLEEKYSQPYRCYYVFHPVRGEVIIENLSETKFFPAPLFGGPVMSENEEVEVLLKFAGFTKKTEFLTDNKFAEEVYIGRPAGIRGRDGKRKIYLFSPHLEHPDYEEANNFLEKIILEEAGEGDIPRENFREISSLNVRKILSDLRIRIHAEANSLEGYMGYKYLANYHFLTFIEEMWKIMKGKKNICVMDEEEENFLKNARIILNCMKEKEFSPAFLLQRLGYLATHVFNWDFREMRRDFLWQS